MIQKRFREGVLKTQAWSCFAAGCGLYFIFCLFPEKDAGYFYLCFTVRTVKDNTLCTVLKLFFLHRNFTVQYWMLKYLAGGFYIFILMAAYLSAFIYDPHQWTCVFFMPGYKPDNTL
jgi:hypothetical protein